MALLNKEVPNMKELMDNAIELNQLLQHTTINPPMVDNKGAPWGTESVLGDCST